ncbi:MAG: hypothetical protein V8T51_01540 [Senegalimassilia faecalis]
MDDSIQELRQELFSAVVRMRRASTHPPVPVGVTPAEGQAMIAIARLEQQEQAFAPAKWPNAATQRQAPCRRC